jgi:hypothetical protein
MYYDISCILRIGENRVRLYQLFWKSIVQPFEEEAAETGTRAASDGM